MGEKFAANPATGTGSLTLPLPLSPGRGGGQPQITLSYDSGGGNGPFGLGWSLDVPAVTRKTDKGLPTYDDAAESDVFTLARSEDLVPAYRLRPDRTVKRDASGRAVRDVEERGGYRVARYRSRTERTFSRVERWTNITDAADVFWRVVSRDNVASVFGRDTGSRITDPADPARIFSWLLSETSDDRGNVVEYIYRGEDGSGVDLSDSYESAERLAQCTANRYLKEIRYGNVVSRLHPDPPSDAAGRWHYRVVLDYGEGHLEHLSADPGRPENEQLSRLRASPTAGTQAPMRPDPFSSYRAGFELRTYRRCKAVLMFHAEMPGTDGLPFLVRALELGYDDAPAGLTTRELLTHPGSTPFASVLTSVTEHGVVRPSDPVVAGPDASTWTTYVRQSLPPVRMRYARPPVQREVHRLPPESEHPRPFGSSGATTWVDLDGDGIPGVLCDKAGALWYQRNEGGGRLAAPTLQSTRPAGGLEGGRQLLDLGADGHLDLVDLEGPTPGFHERTTDGSWAPHRAFASLPVLDWTQATLDFADLTGDGYADVLLTDPDREVWFPSLAEDGFGPARRVMRAQPSGAEPFAIEPSNDAALRVVDLTGDGLGDLVRVRDGEICYWPNLGHGRFGRKVVMGNPPHLGADEPFDPARVLFADLDGTGASDIVLLRRGGAELWFNRSGNSWSDPVPLGGFAVPDGVSSVVVADLLGRGSPCVVRSSSLPADAGAPVTYVDVFGGRKPYLLVGVANGRGAETEITYVPSTDFALRDRAEGSPWLTRLPFPVHVVERVETADRISGSRFITRYEYAHGLYEDREFRGFGRVDQFDSAERDAGDGSPPADGVVATSPPPVLTRTWFHTGAYLDRDRISTLYAGTVLEPGEYYREPGLTGAAVLERLLDDTPLPPGLNVWDESEACRALRGAMLRQEVFALDGTDGAGFPFGHPYLVVEQNFTLRREQPRENNRHAVFFAHPRESFSYHYEREPEHPRVLHDLTLAVNEFGDVTRSVRIAYGRAPDSSLPSATQTIQATAIALCTETRYTAWPLPGAPAGEHRAPAPWDTSTWELTGLNLPPGAVLSIDDAALLTEATEIAPHLPAPVGAIRRRPVSRERTRYRRDDLTGPCPDGFQDLRGLVHERYRLALTPEVISASFCRPSGAGGAPLIPDPATVLPVDAATDAAADRGGHVDLDGDGRWWAPSGRGFYAPPGTDPTAELDTARRHFFLLRHQRSPFHLPGRPAETLVDHDLCDLLPVRTTDAVGNVSTVENDYRVLAPTVLTDPNGNRTAVAFDALGLVVATAVTGKDGTPGDTVDDVDALLTPAAVRRALEAPLTDTATLLGSATTRLIYDLFAYGRAAVAARREPLGVLTISRETHTGDLVPGAVSGALHVLTYHDGLGRDLQSKTRAEGGPVPERDAAGRIAVVAGRPRMTTQPAEPRWVGSGWTEYDAKGDPIRVFEPFFSDTHRPDFDVAIGVASRQVYDPLRRLVAVLHPNGTYEKVVFDAWRHANFDVNDTCAPTADGLQTGDPRTDPDVAPLAAVFLGELDPAWTTWYARRRNGALGQAERIAAEQAAAHAGTPTTTYLDPLGRTVLSRASLGLDPQGEPVLLDTRTDLDVQGNARAVVDALGRTAARYSYDLLGNRLRVETMDAGTRWSLTDVTGQEIRLWDSRGHVTRSSYDVARRRRAVAVRGTDAAQSDPRTLAAEVVVAATEYGEDAPDPAGRNLRGRVHRERDGAGRVTVEYDGKGNVVLTTREVTTDHRALTDWAGTPAVGAGAVAGTRYDALNRPVQLTGPSLPGAPVPVVQPVHGVGNLLSRVDVWLARPTRPSGVLDPRIEPPSGAGITRLEHDARGRRMRVVHGNGVVSNYVYDPDTFRLAAVYTRRGPAFAEDCGGDPPPPLTAAPEVRPTGVPCGVQNLRFTYDPVGNVIRVTDDAQQRVFFRNAVVEATADHVYDAVYRLVQATGREHVGQAGGTPTSHSFADAHRTGRPHPQDGGAMSRYCETYEYDAVGNLVTLRHAVACPGAETWSRSFRYEETSLLESGADGTARRSGNRLTASTVGGSIEVYSAAGTGYDGHGNQRTMSHLQELEWDHADRLRVTRRQAVGPGDASGVERQAERTFYVDDRAGRRVRKVTELPGGAIKDERVYLGGVEVYRVHAGADAGLVRETLHVMDDQQRILLVETRTDTAGAEPVVRYQHGNLLGSAVLELDESGEIVSYEEYTPYGSTTYQAVRADVQASPKRYRYSARERDEESGLYYHGARYYAPWLARWTAADPLLLRDSPNVYLYALANPVIAKDPSGGPVWLIPVVIYLGWRALESAAETGVEAGIAKATGEEDFSPLGSFAKNMAVNSVVGLVPGAVEAKVATKVAIYGTKLAVRTAGDATYDTLRGKGDFGENLLKSGAGNIVGDGIGALAKKGAGKMFSKAVDKVGDPVAGTSVAKGTQQAANAAGTTVQSPVTMDSLFAAADGAVRAARQNAAPAVAAATLGRVGTVNTRAGFRQAVIDLIAADPQHPLKFLLNPAGRLRNTTAAGVTQDVLFDNPEMIEAGHVLSSKALTGALQGTDKFAVMSGFWNRFISGTIEHPSKGGTHMAVDEVIDIGGIPVHLQTAAEWIQRGLLDSDLVAKARRVVY
ncbi:hypothetical protein KKR89_09960 [Cellulomonas dongxiuzhuiae]|uniref:Sugar-binding protein n=2 Tax=Cellulomonas dongxiuzhuiae TaxID=2819979 RepID=A0ABX8GFP9_9CELL|nr:SpvB/TcaC N-terminal domain-containing protein [Cellulomonas dongxiuzhuiae]QWC14702.1 hypothetical protein KKR89_09960 [Cellulomonas dongxiuzhuiae]